MGVHVFPIQLPGLFKYLLSTVQVNACRHQGFNYCIYVLITARGIKTVIVNKIDRALTSVSSNVMG